MPRRKVKKKAAVQGQVPLLQDLAAAFGVHANTITAWRDRGAPAGPPFSIVEWYVWAHRQGYKPQLPADPDLRALCERTLPQQRSTTQAPEESGVTADLIQLGKELGVDTPNEGALQEDLRVLAWQRWAATIDRLQTIRTNRRDLIPRAEITPFLEGLAAAARAQDLDLPVKVCDHLVAAKVVIAADLRDAIIGAVDAEVRAAREALRNLARSSARKLLSTTPKQKPRTDDPE